MLKRKQLLPFVPLFILLLSCNVLFAQDNYLPYSNSAKNKSNGIAEINRNIEFTFGLIPEEDHRAIKANMGINNLVLKRFGGYTSLEWDTNTQSWTNTCGGTVSIFKYLYLWGGLDLFTNKGLIQAGFSSSRKEIGIGITPYKGFVLRTGWSNSVGISVTAGYQIHF